MKILLDDSSVKVGRDLFELTAGN